MEKIEKFLKDVDKFLDKVILHTARITLLVLIIMPVIKLFNK